jgi:hypothetical protein
MADPLIGLNGQNTVNVVGGPTLTASGIGVAGADLANTPGTDLALGGATRGDLAAVKATFDKVIRWRNRWEPMYRSFATTGPASVAHPGSKITMFRTGKKGLDLATTPLSEYEDPDAKPLPGIEERLDLTMDEYGDATVTTMRLREYAWTDINPMQIEYVRRHMRDTVDAIYMNAIYSTTGGYAASGAGTGFKQYVGAAAGAITAAPAGAYSALGAQSLAAGHIRRVVAEFRNEGVIPFNDGLYLGLITPDISVALRETTDLAGWRYPHLDGTANNNIWRGTVGVFEGVMFIESPQYQGLDKGGSVDPTVALVDQTPTDTDAANILFIGAEGLVEGVVREPGATILPQQDKFGRLVGLGWYGWFGCQVGAPEAGILLDVKNG